MTHTEYMLHISVRRIQIIFIDDYIDQFRRLVPQAHTQSLIHGLTYTVSHIKFIIIISKKRKLLFKKKKILT